MGRKREYAEIKIYDLIENKTRTITKKSRFFEPDLSPNLKSIVSVEFSKNQIASLVILNSINGIIQKRFYDPEKSFIVSPIWSDDGKQIAYISQNKKGRSLKLLNIKTSHLTTLIPYKNESIGYLKFYNNYILYTSPYSGIDNIYAINIKTKKKHQITSVKYGAYNHDISKDKKRLIFSNYTINGFDVVEMPLKIKSWKSISTIQKITPDYFKPIEKQKHSDSIPNYKKIPQKKYKVKKYKPLKNIFNIHSWGIIPDDTGLFLGLFSDNILGTASFNTGVKYNTNEKTAGYEINGSYSGFFPVITFSASYNNRSLEYKNEIINTINFKWKEKNIGLGTAIPMNFSRGIYKTRLNLAVNIFYKEITLNENSSAFWNIEGRLYPISFSLIFSNSKKSSSRYIKPSMAQLLSFSYKKTLNISTLTGSMLSIKSKLFFPGLKKNNSFILRAGYEIQHPENYIFSNLILFSRGYEYHFHNSLFILSTDYFFPLFYPDFAIGDFLYIRRLSLDLFYDYCIGKTEEKTSKYNSIGFEILADISLFNIPFRFEIGPRISYRFFDKKIKFNLISLYLGF